MILKSTFRLIKTTLNRFIAILAIVFIGVAFMMGLRSSYDIMKRSVDDYIDEANLYDIQIYSNFGFDENDKIALENQENIKQVFASRTRDVYMDNQNGEPFVARVLELESNINKFELIEGSLPSKANECIVITGFAEDGTRIGDSLSMYLNDEDLSESFKNTEFVVSGIAKSSEYICLSFPKSLLENKELGIIVYIPNVNFTSKYYTTLFATFNNNENYSFLSNEYETFIDDNIEKLESFTAKQALVRKDTIIEEANEKLEKARNEFNNIKAEYEKKINDGKIELDKAKKELDDAKAKIEYGEKEIPQKENELKQAEILIEEGYKTLQEKESQLNQAIGTIEKYGMSVDELSNYLNNIYSKYQDAVAAKNSLDQRLNDLFDSKRNAEEIVNSSGYSNGFAVYYDMLKAERGSDEYNHLRTIYDAFKEVSETEIKISNLTIELTAVDDTIRSLNNTLLNKFGMNVEEGYAYLSTKLNEIKNGRELIENGYAEIDRNNRLIAEGKLQIEQAKKDLIDGKKQYEDGLILYANGLKEYNEGVKKFKHEIQNAEDKLADAEEEIKNIDNVDWTTIARYYANSSIYMYKNNCEQMKSIGTVVPIFFFIVAVLVCATTMTRLIDEQRVQIGIYSALGFKKHEIISIYLLYVLFASLAASIIAVFAGVIIFPPIIYNTWRMLYDLPKIHLLVPFKNLIICILSFTILMIVVTMTVLFISLKDESAELLRTKAPKYSKNIALENIKWLWNRLSFTSKVTARNLFRYKFRFLMTVIGVAGCAALLLLGGGIKDSVGGMVNLQFKDVNRHNYIVYLKNDRHIDEILEEIKLDKNNEESYPYVSYDTIIETENSKKNDPSKYLSIVVLNENNYNSLFSIKNSKNHKEVELISDGAYITKKFAQIYNIKVNDEIQAESYSGKKANVKVKGIVDNYIQHYMYMSEDYYRSVFDEDIEYNVIGIVNEETSQVLANLANEFNDVSVVNDFNSSINYFSKLVESLNMIILLVIMCAGALAFVVLINLTNVNISERIREIATLKVLGFRQIEVNSYIFKEVLLMSFIGSLIGLPLGRIAVVYVMHVINMDMVMFPIIVKPISYLYAFSLTVLFTLIVLIFTRKTLKDIKMVESLKTIE